MADETRSWGWLVAVVLLVGFSVWIHYEVKVQQQAQSGEQWLDSFTPDTMRPRQPPGNGQAGGGRT